MSSFEVRAMKKLLAVILTLWLAPAWAQVPMTGAGKGTPETPATFNITFGSSVGDNTSQTSYSLASVGIGSADPNRYVVVAVCIRSSNAISTPTVTVGGSSATKIVEMISGAGPATYSALFQVPSIVSSGTSATVAISGFGSAAARAAAQGYSVVTNTSALPSGSAVTAMSVGGLHQMTGSVTVPSNGRSIVAMCNALNGSPSTFAAPVSNITVDQTGAIGGASTTETFSGHDTANRTGATTYTTQSITINTQAAVTAAWAP